MAATNQWNENSPKGTDLISSGDDEIRKFKLDVRERLNLEHFWGVDLTQDGKHRHITLTPAGDVTAITGGGNVMTGPGGGGLIHLSQTWNGPAHYDGLRMDITDVASAPDSHLIHMTLNGAPVFTISKTGLVVGGGGGSGSDIFNNPVTFVSTTHFVGQSTFDSHATFNGGLTSNATSYFNGDTNFATGQVHFGGPQPVVFDTPVIFNGLATFNGGTSGVGGGGAGGEAFPIGAVFLSVVATSPVTMLGYGAWTQFGQGRMLVGVNPGEPEFAAPEQIGGEKAHTLTEGELPSHNHDGWDGGHVHKGYWGETENMQTAVPPSGWVASGTSPVWTDIGYADVHVGHRGGGAAHNNLPPYITVYMWKRVG